MKPGPFRRRSWRYYRNWLIFMLMWAVVLITAIWALRSSWLVFLLWAIPAYVVGSTIYYAYYLTHPRVKLRMRNLTPGDAGLEYEQVQFPSRDGLSLFGWYVPGRKRATIILVHGGGSHGMAMIYHASGLALYDYGVLMFDLRAHGSSEGDVCTSGWREVEDLLGAVDYVQSRGDVDADGIGVLGLSLGGQVALRAAVQSEAIRAVVAEGPSPAALADHGGRPTRLLGWLYLPVNWLHYAMLSFMNGTKPPQGVLAAIRDLAPRPVLLISAGKRSEQRFGRMLYRAASEPKELWELPEAKHGGAYFLDPEAYATRVSQFFDAALVGGRGQDPESVEAPDRED